jgi:hypothetical protein
MPIAELATRGDVFPAAIADLVAGSMTKGWSE